MAWASLFPALTCGAGVGTDGLVRGVLFLVQFWRRHPDHWAEGVTEEPTSSLSSPRCPRAPRTSNLASFDSPTMVAQRVPAQTDESNQAPPTSLRVGSVVSILIYSLGSPRCLAACRLPQSAGFHRCLHV
jgi:hypothetical protein